MIDFSTTLGCANFYFVRHGESEGNVRRITQGRVDMALTDHGREQAARVGRWLADKEIDLILSSPLLRATETANLIASATGHEHVEISAALNEIDIGLFSGLRWQDSAAQYPKAYRQFFQQSWDGVPGAEHSSRIFVRAGQVWQEVLAHMAAGRSNIVAVTHSGLLQWIIKTSLGHRQWQPLFPMHNCSIFQFHINNRMLAPDDVVPDETPAYYCAWELIDHQV